MTKINLFKIYNDTITIVKNNVIASLLAINYKNISEMESLISNITHIVKYMLNDRFLPSQKKPKKEVDNRSTDLKRFLGVIPMTKEKVVIENIQPLDIIKFFKVLENFMLRRTYMSDIKDLRLGNLRPYCEAIYNSLPTLLLSVDVLNDMLKNQVLNMIFSCISVYRLFKVKAVPDTSTITNPYDGKDIDLIINNEFNIESISRWIKEFCSDFDFVSEQPRLVMYSGNASSPNGGASTNSLYSDVQAITSDTRLWASVIKMCSHFKNGKDLLKLVNLIKENIKFENNYQHSRLFSFTAQGGKARIIANVDWITQSALSGIHFLLFAILKTIPCDFTFDHKGGIGYVLSAEKVDGYNYYSIDLSAATDRLPRLLQQCIIHALFNNLNMDGKSISEAWINLVDRTYDTKSTKLNNELPTRYAVGQGMGLFTSFPVMALMHHFIVNSIIGISKNRYCIVGDDLLFYGTSQEFNNYVNFMKEIGVTVNLTKTIECLNADRPTIEFARNFYIDGIKINPISFGTMFAFNDNKINLETMVWSLSKSLSLKLILEILMTVGFKVSYSDIRNLAYYCYKNLDIDFSQVYNLCNSIFRLPKWFTKDNLDRIITIASIGDQNKTIPYINSEFMASYTSSCIVRHYEEIEKNHLIANSISLLAIVDKTIFDISQAIHNRLMNTDIITYDTELKGGPLLTKRERNLIQQIEDRD